MKRMLIIVVVVLLSSTTRIAAQRWHLYSDTLRLPVNQYGFQTANGFFNRLDTVSCYYRVKGSDAILTGFKLVYVLNGYYTDLPSTVDVFFDDKKQRTYDVSEYAFN